MGYEPLHHKYRPQTFADLVGQEAIAHTLTNALNTKRIAPAYLFTGARGTGKTSSARIMAKSLNCLSFDHPTPTPCGKCELCHSIANGNALDITEIDAASNTGVDNIRELIERSQFAPVKARFKVYIIDECLTGDTLVQTDSGFMRLDNQSLQGKQVLSYNEQSEKWEYKKVLRWLERGMKSTLILKTSHYSIQCTGNHLIRTNLGWIKASNIKAGMNILSPVPADVEKVESVTLAGEEKVYDIEVEDNHNFVANGLLVHNCHMLSTAAFNALLKTLEEPPDRVTFILATTDPQRVLPTIISRCQRFDFRRIPLEAMVQHLVKIAQNESINIHQEAITLISQIAQGGLRDAESLLDQLSLVDGEIDVGAVWDLVGSVPEQDLLSLIESIANDRAIELIEYARRIMDRGREPLIVLQNLANVYRDLLIAKTASDRRDLVAMTSSGWDRLVQLTQFLSTPQILQGQTHLRSAEFQIRNSTQPRLWLEVTLMGLLPSALGEIATSPIAVNKSANKPVTAISANNTNNNTTNQIPTQSIQPTTKTSNSPPAIASNQLLLSEPSLSVPAPQETISTPTAVATPIYTGDQDLEEFASVGYDLEQVWQQVLSTLQPSTNALLTHTMKAHITSIENQKVKLCLAVERSKQIENHATEKRPELEAAFTRILGRAIKVAFHCNVNPNSDRNDHQIASNQLAHSPISTSPSVANISTPYIPPSSSEAVSSNNGKPSTSTSDPNQVISPPKQNPPAAIGSSEEDFVFRNIAEFFNGQIVELEE